MSAKVVQSNVVTVMVPAPPPAVLVNSAHGFAAPFAGLWETQFDGYTSAAAPSQPNLGSCTPPSALGVAIMAVGYVPQDGSGQFGFTPFNILVVPAGTSQTFFTSLTITKTGGATHTYLRSAANFRLSDDNGAPGATWPTWFWPVASDIDFADGVITSITFNA